MFALIKFLFRLLGLVLIAAALLALVADGSRSIARSELVLMPLGQAWYSFSPETLNMAQAAIQRNVNPVLWDPIVQTILTFPVWGVAAPLGILCLLVGARRKKRKLALA